MMAAAILVACVPIPPRPSLRGVLAQTNAHSEIDYDMSMEQIEAKLGAPEKVGWAFFGGRKVTTFTYHHSKSLVTNGEIDFRVRYLSVLFADKRVVGWTYRSNFESDSTYFDASKREKFTLHKTTMDDVFATLGDPSGQGSLPEFPIHNDATIPDRLKSETVWLYNYINTTQGRVTRQVLYLFFDAEERLVYQHLLPKLPAEPEGNEPESQPKESSRTNALSPPSASCKVQYERLGRIVVRSYVEGGMKNSKGKIIGGQTIPAVTSSTGHFNRESEGVFLVGYLTPTCVTTPYIPILYGMARVAELAHENGFKYVELLAVEGEKGYYTHNGNIASGTLGNSMILFRGLEAPNNTPNCFNASKFLHAVVPKVRKTKRPKAHDTITGWFAAHPCPSS